MNKHQIAYLHLVVDQANSADMDIGLSVNILAALLDERAALVAALQHIATMPIESHICRDNAMQAVARAAIAKAGAR